MASTLLGGRGKDRVVDKGHGPEALGPGDTTDSGADIAGTPGAEGDTIEIEQRAAEALDTETRADADITPDHIEAVGEALIEDEANDDREEER